MEKSTIVVFSFSLAVAIIAMATNTCMDIPSMDIARACHQASTSVPMYGLCMKTMNGVKDNGEVPTYALAAASAAAQSYDFTVAVARDNIVGEMKAACEFCMRKYDEAQKIVNGVVGSLRGCFFDGVEAECVEAVVAVDDCATEVMLVKPDAPPPLHAMVLDDRDRTVLALRLISLLGEGVRLPCL